MPGSPPSAEPAIEDPATTNTKARIKLTVGMVLSPDFVTGAARPSWLRVDTHEPFPEFCTPSEKWFRRNQNCFVASRPTKYCGLNPNRFNDLQNRH
jgi:hypothetical protein